MKTRQITKNPLSNLPGGSTLTFYYHQALPDSRGSIKYPTAYVDKVVKEKLEEGTPVAFVVENDTDLIYSYLDKSMDL
jgi:hypothetical protein